MWISSVNDFFFTDMLKEISDLFISKYKSYINKLQ